MDPPIAVQQATQPVQRVMLIVVCEAAITGGEKNIFPRLTENLGEEIQIRNVSHMTIDVALSLALNPQRFSRSSSLAIRSFDCPPPPCSQCETPGELSAVQKKTVFFKLNQPSL